MALTVTHTFVSPVIDELDPNIVGPDEWNAVHTITGTIAASDVTPAGSNTYIQFNDGGVLGADAGLVFDKTSGVFQVTSSDNNAYWSTFTYPTGGGQLVLGLVHAAYNDDGYQESTYHQYSRGTAVSPLPVQIDDWLGVERYYGQSDTTTGHMGEAANIIARVDSSTIATNSVPGRLIFSTTPVGGTAALERLRIDKNGYVTGGYGAVVSSNGLTPAISFAIDPTTTAGTAIFAQGANASPATIGLIKNRGATPSSHTIVSANDQIGALAFVASDGVDYKQASAIVGFVDGTPGTNDMPGGLLFFTTPDGSTTLAERMRIDNAGRVGMGDIPTAATGFVVIKPNTIPTGTSFLAIDCYDSGSGGTNSNVFLYIDNYNNDGYGDGLYLDYGRGTKTSPAIVNSGDSLGIINFGGVYDTVQGPYTSSAISGYADGGTYSATSHPGGLIFSTTPDGTLNPIQRFWISGVGHVGINTVPNIAGWAAGNWRVLSIKGANKGGVVELISQEPDAADNFIGFIDFSTISNTAPNTEVAQFGAQTEGTTANNRGGRLVFFTKEDGTSNVPERMRIDSNGYITGGYGAVVSASGFTPAISFAIDPTTLVGTAIFGVGANASPPAIALVKTRGASPSSHTIVAASDQLGGLTFAGSDGATYQQAAAIVAEVDGTPGLNDMPGRLLFFTTPDGSTTLTERMRIESTGAVNINVPGTSIDPLFIYTKAFYYPTVLGVDNNAAVGWAYYPKNGAGTYIPSYFLATASNLEIHGPQSGTLYFGTDDGGGALVEHFHTSTAGVFAPSGAVIDFGSGDVTITHSANTLTITGGVTVLDNLSKINSLPLNLTDAGFDVLIGWDDSAGQVKNFALADLTTEAAPAAGDYVVLYGAEGDVRKVNWSSLPGVGGGINNVVEDTTPQLGGDLYSNNFQIILEKYSADAVGQNLGFFKSRGAAPPTNTIVQSGDQLGAIGFTGANGTTYDIAAGISAYVDGTPGASADMPGRLVFLTTPDGSGTPVEHLRIDNAGHLIYGGSAGHNTVFDFLPDVEFSRGGGITVAIHAWAATDDNSAFLSFAKAATDTPGTYTALSSSDRIAYLGFSGADGTHFVEAANILVSVDGTPAANDMPGKIVFSTTPSGDTAVERMRIDSAGHIIAGGGQAYASIFGTIPNLSTNASAPVWAISAWSTGGDPELYFTKSRGSVGVHTAVIAEDFIGYIAGAGSDGTDFGTESWYIAGIVDGAVAANSVPSRIMFGTTAVGATSTAERMRIDSVGSINIGNGGGIISNLYGAIPLLQVSGTGATTTPALDLRQYSNNTNSSTVAFTKSRGASVGTNTVVQSGDGLGFIVASGYDATGTPVNRESAWIFFSVDAAPTAGSVPGNIRFATAPSGSASAVERMLINSAGNLVPAVNDGAALGDTSLKWADLFLASGAVVNFNAGNATITHSAGVLRFNDIRIELGASSDYALTKSGTSLEIWANTGFTWKTGTAGATTTMLLGTANLTPGANDLVALGSAATSWADLFLASGALINFNNGNVVVTHSSGKFNISTGALQVASQSTAGLVQNDSSGNYTTLSTLKKSIWIPANAMTANTTNGAASGSVEMTTNKNMFTTLDFDTSTQEFAQFEIKMPNSWNEGTVTFVPVWSHASTATNFGVVWGLDAVALSDDDAGDVAFGTPQTSTDTGGTTNDIYHGPESAAITIAGTPATGDYIMFRIHRDPANGSDTLGIDARLHGIMVYYTQEPHSADG